MPANLKEFVIPTEGFSRAEGACFIAPEGDARLDVQQFSTPLSPRAG